MMVNEQELIRATEAIQSSPFTIALTGAGVSVESGLADFRSPGGLWTKYDVNEYAHIAAFRRNPEKVWHFVEELLRCVGDVQPNAGHKALAELEKAGRLNAVITQNIDNLHQAAGSEYVVEFHGSMANLVCLGCGARFRTDNQDIMTTIPPLCPCGRVLKPDFIFFGEAIPPDALEQSFALARQCKVLLVAGTSAEVAPASYIPFEARATGATIIELNLQPTILTDQITDIFLEGPFAQMMPELARRVLQLDR